MAKIETRLGFHLDLRGLRRKGMNWLHPSPAAGSEEGRAAAGSTVPQAVVRQDVRHRWLLVRAVKRGGSGSYGEWGRVTLGASRNKR